MILENDIRRNDTGSSESCCGYINLGKRFRSGFIPLHLINGILKATLAGLSDAFNELSWPDRRQSIPPSDSCRRFLLQAFLPRSTQSSNWWSGSSSTF